MRGESGSLRNGGHVLWPCDKIKVDGFVMGGGVAGTSGSVSASSDLDDLMATVTTAASTASANGLNTAAILSNISSPNNYFAGTDLNAARYYNLAQVSADVEKAMQAQGWKREMSMQSSADSATLIYTKDKRQAVYQMIKADNGGTQLAVRTGAPAYAAAFAQTLLQPPAQAVLQRMGFGRP